MRQLSPTFLKRLKSGFLSGITERVRSDPDLNLEIRDSAIALYCKGNSLLTLTEAWSSLYYKVEIPRKLQDNLEIPPDVTKSTADQFVASLPRLKENMIRHGQQTFEREYEQMLIYANNIEPRNHTEYFIVDRQYPVNGSRFDLTAIHWASKGRKRRHEVPLCLLDIKFAHKADIQNLPEHLARSYAATKARASVIAEEMETIFRQKLALRLYRQRSERLRSMQTLRFSRHIEDFQFILVLVDYNQGSRQLALEQLRKLPFAKQIKVFHSGFGMWQENVSAI